jgi:hypothetical protein
MIFKIFSILIPLSLLTSCGEDLEKREARSEVNGAVIEEEPNEKQEAPSDQPDEVENPPLQEGGIDSWEPDPDFTAETGTLTNDKIAKCGSSYSQKLSSNYSVDYLDSKARKTVATGTSAVEVSASSIEAKLLVNSIPKALAPAPSTRNQAMYQSEVRRFNGLRHFKFADAAQRKKVKSDNKLWEKIECAVMMTQTQEMILHGKKYKISYAPTVPYFINPMAIEKVLNEDLGKGLSFEKITATIESIDGVAYTAADKDFDFDMKITKLASPNGIVSYKTQVLPIVNQQHEHTNDSLIEQHGLFRSMTYTIDLKTKKFSNMAVQSAWGTTGTKPRNEYTITYK